VQECEDDRGMGEGSKRNATFKPAPKVKLIRIPQKKKGWHTIPE
jgi:hypothetical protein